MKSNELRIGNWVNHNGNPMQIITGAQIDKNVEELTPIKLTTELLTSNGLGLANREPPLTPIYKYGIVEFWTTEDNSIYFSTGVGNVEIKYVHQFQNLIHAITGEEIKIEL